MKQTKLLFLLIAALALASCGSDEPITKFGSYWYYSYLCSRLMSNHQI